MCCKTNGREKGGELEWKGSAAIGSVKLARDKGEDKAREGVRAEGKNVCKGERTPGYHRKMEFFGEEQLWSSGWK